MKPAYRWLWLVLVSLVLVACSTVKTASATSQASTPSTKKNLARNGAYFQHDGPADHIPVNLDLVPNAVPQNEPLIKSANLPYSVLGMSFRPDTSNTPYRAKGIASWYGKQFHGRRTTSGERYDMFAMTAAHPTLPIPSYVRVTNLKNGKTVVVRINDRGPFHKGRILDLSYAAAHKLGFAGLGKARVMIERVWPTTETASTTTGNADEAALKQEDGPKYLQLGAFSQLSNAEAMLKRMVDKVDANYDPKLGIVNQRGTYMVRLGPFDTTADVRSAAEALNVENIVMN
jgi:rare lipoprotein A